MEICPVGADLFHADRRTDGQADGRKDMTKLIVAFRNVADAPKIANDDAEGSTHEIGSV